MVTAPDAGKNVITRVSTSVVEPQGVNFRKRCSLGLKLKMDFLKNSTDGLLLCYQKFKAGSH